MYKWKIYRINDEKLFVAGKSKKAALKYLNEFNLSFDTKVKLHKISKKKSLKKINKITKKFYQEKDKLKEWLKNNNSFTGFVYSQEYIDLHLKMSLLRLFTEA